MWVAAQSKCDSLAFYEGATTLQVLFNRSVGEKFRSRNVCLCHNQRVRERERNRVCVCVCVARLVAYLFFFDITVTRRIVCCLRFLRVILDNNQSQTNWRVKRRAAIKATNDTRQNKLCSVKIHTIQFTHTHTDRHTRDLRTMLSRFHVAIVI